MQKNNRTSTSLITKDDTPKKVYMVLKKKAIKESEIVRAITEETCKRLECWLEQNKASLQEKLKDFDDPKRAFECFMLKKLMAILAQMEEEYKGKLNERDLKAYRELIEDSKSEFESNDGADSFKIINTK